ncbi:hypothetical protein [Novosphingobium sp. fls2-241-R2A-195]|uniref:hypothetical protein n=1 Tax=Novosphingobium sp. fls2-241-R2A-195 TaxID=3040296 RepID=UPI00254AD886|nr:hypothetical protein [Novosphingobium sp. fls2-241-R2A-195]
MTDDSPNSAAKSPPSITRAEARADEAAAIRRRWITLGEVLTVIAVTISGLTLWNSWSQRSETEAGKNADAQRASTKAATLTLVAARTDDDELVLKPASPEQSVQSQSIAFPSALALAAAETTGEPRIEARWFENALKKARSRARLPDSSRGDEKLPILVTTRFLADGKLHEELAIYDIGYSIAGRWLGGHSITLRGVSLVARTRKSAGKSLLDARWKAVLAQAGT